MSQIRKILHLDLDAFFCAVEENENPDLRGKPFAVGGRPDQRGVVASCSYAARAFGIHSAMPMSRAVLRCPQLIIVPNRHGLYGKASRRVMAHLHNLSPLVEQISIDEAFLDVTGRAEYATDLAQRLQATINTEENLSCSLGVATNKLVAKIANTVGKAEVKGAGPPNAIKVIRPGQEAAFLATLDLEALWGVGPKTAERLRERGMHTIGDIAAYPEADLTRLLGKVGAELSLRAKGIDHRPVVTESETKSISNETTFIHDVDDPTTLHHTLIKLAEKVASRARRAELSGRTVHIKLRWADFTTFTRQMTLSQPTQSSELIISTVLSLFNTHWIRGKKVRLLGVGLSGFENVTHQLSLWDVLDDHQADDRLESALDEIRERFGDRSVRRASDLWLEDFHEDD